MENKLKIKLQEHADSLTTFINKFKKINNVLPFKRKKEKVASNVLSFTKEKV